MIFIFYNQSAYHPIFPHNVERLLTTLSKLKYKLHLFVIFFLQLSLKTLEITFFKTFHSTFLAGACLLTLAEVCLLFWKPLLPSLILGPSKEKLYITNNYLCNSSINYCLQGCYFHYNIRIGRAAIRKQTVDIMTFT